MIHPDNRKLRQSSWHMCCLRPEMDDRGDGGIKGMGWAAWHQSSSVLLLYISSDAQTNRLDGVENAFQCTNICKMLLGKGKCIYWSNVYNNQISDNSHKKIITKLENVILIGVPVVKSIPATCWFRIATKVISLRVQYFICKSRQWMEWVLEVILNVRNAKVHVSPTFITVIDFSFLTTSTKYAILLFSCNPKDLP